MKLLPPEGSKTSDEVREGWCCRGGHDQFRLDGKPESSLAQRLVRMLSHRICSLTGDSQPLHWGHAPIA